MNPKKQEAVEQYSLVRKLSQGGMGQVWLAKHQRTRHFYAAKFLSSLLARDKNRERFKREMEVLRTLDHPAVIRMYDLVDSENFDDKDRYQTGMGIPSFLGHVMQYCPDGDLHDFLHRHPDADFTPYMEQQDDAVTYLHAHKFIHRDIKPTNLLIAQDRGLRLSDFGLVVSSEPDRKVIMSSIWASEGFAAPQQFEDMASVTHKADLYSTGAVWYYFLTRRTLKFREDAESQLKELNLIARCVVRQLHQRHPGGRPTSLSFFLGALKDLKQLDHYDLSPVDLRQYLHGDIPKRREILEEGY